MDTTTLRDAPRTGTTADWETINCPLCGHSQSTTFYEAPDVEAPQGPTYTVVRCRQCGLCYTNPRPTPAAIGQFYPTGYAPHQKREESAPRRRRRFRPLAWLNNPRLERREPKPQGECRLLDFGCGAGEFLMQMRDAGWRVTGMDASPPMVASLRARGIPAVTGTLPHADLKPGSFDVVTMWHSLEHVHRPLAVLEAARELLVPGGRLMVSVPNIESLPFRWFGPAWHGLELPRHLTHFAPATLRAMVRQAGFRVERLRYVLHLSWMEISTERAQARQIGPAWLPWLTRHPLRKVVPWYCALRRRSDCIVLTAIRDEGV